MGGPELSWVIRSNKKSATRGVVLACGKLVLMVIGNDARGVLLLLLLLLLLLQINPPLRGPVTLDLQTNLQH